VAAELAAHVGQCAELAKPVERVLGGRDGDRRNGPRRRSFGDEIDDPRRRREAVEQGTDALQRLDPLLVVHQADVVLDGEAAVEPIARGFAQVDAPDVEVIRNAALGVRVDHAGHILERFERGLRPLVLQLLFRYHALVDLSCLLPDVLFHFLGRLLLALGPAVDWWRPGRSGG